MQVLENIIHRLRLFATSHAQIQAFSHGQVTDFDLEKQSMYPVMHVVWNGCDVPSDLKELTYSFQILFADKPTIQQDKTEQALYAMSDCVNYALDLLAVIEQGGYNDIFDDHFSIGSSSIQAVQEAYSNVLWGCILNIGITVHQPYNLCDAPIGTIGGSFTPCTLCSVVSGATALEILECLTNEQEAALSAELCEEGGTATYTNGAAFTQEIAAGTTFTAPEISVTQVDGSVDDIVPNIDVVCEWSPLQVVTSDSNLVFNVNTYPTNGEIVLPIRRISDGATTFILPHRNRTFITNARLSAAVNDTVDNNGHNLTVEVDIPVVNSAGQSLGVNVDDLLTSHVVGDVTLDDDDSSQDFPMPTIILFDGVIDSAAYSVVSGNGMLTITPAPPAPPALIPAVVLVTQFTSYRQRDEGWAVTNNRFNYLSTGITQSIDRAAASPWTTLANTHLSSTARFRDTSNNALAYGDSPTANNIVRDYLTDFEYYTERFTDGEGFDDICDKVAGLTLGGHSDWVLVPRALMVSLWDMNNTNAPNTLNGRPPGFNNNWHNSVMTGTTYDVNTAQVYVTFSNGTVRRTTIVGKTAGALDNYIVCRRMNSY
jgi:hypothetical protein